MELRAGYKQTEVGMIPEDWEIVSIGNIADILVGKDVNEQHFSKIHDQRFKFPVYSNTVSNQGFFGYYDFPEFSGHAVTVVGRGVGLGTAFSRSGSFGAIGRLVVLFIDKNCDNKFIANFINHKINVFSESSGVPQLTGISISKYLIACPTKTEQTAIANALSDADALIQSLSKLISKKRHIKQGAMQSLLTGRQRLPEFVKSQKYKNTEIGMIPEDWEACKLNNVTISVSSGKSNTRSKIGNYPIYGSTGVIGHKDNFDYQGNKILVARVGANAGTVNKVSGKYCVSDNTLMITFQNNTDIIFFYYQLISKKLNSLVFGSGQPLITGGQIKDLTLPLPPTQAEQTAIATILSDMDSEIAALETKLTKYEKTKQGMMQNLLTGRIRLIENCLSP